MSSTDTSSHSQNNNNPQTTTNVSQSPNSHLQSVQQINEKIQEKIRVIQEEIDAVMNGTHQQYKSEIERLRESKEQKELAAKEFLEMKMESIQKEYESELTQLSSNFEQQVSNIKQSMIDTLLAQQRKIEETGQIDEDEDFMADVANANEVAANNSRKLRRRAKDDVKAIGSVNYNPSRRNYSLGLKINYKLSNQEISQDLGSIRKT